MGFVPWDNKYRYTVQENQECKKKGHDTTILEEEPLMKLVKRYYVELYNVEIPDMDFIFTLHRLRDCFYGQKTKDDPMEDYRLHMAGRALGLFNNPKIERYPVVDQDLINGVGSVLMGYTVCVRCRDIIDYKIIVRTYLEKIWKEYYKLKNVLHSKDEKAQDILTKYKEITHAN